MDIEYFACECCNAMIRCDEIWGGIKKKELHVCINCHDKELAEIEENSRNRCGCHGGCNECLMLEY
jgi:hypothetical protein